MSVRILAGHVLDRLAEIEPGSVQVCVTSPPYYGLRSYGTEPQTWPDGWVGELGQEPTLRGYLDHLLMVFEAVKRVLRDDGTLWVNLGDSYVSTPTGNAGTKSRLNGAQTSKRYARTITEQYTKTTRPDVQPGMKIKDLMLIPHRFAIAMQDRGWWVRNDLVWAKTACMPESVTDRATRSHEYIFHFAKSKTYYYDAEAVKEQATEIHRRPNVRLQAPSPTYQAPGQSPQHLTTKNVDGRHEVTRNQRTVWTIGPEPLRDEHYAAWPTEIPRRCILAGSKPGDTVLDPFIGSGRTGIVADRLGRDCIGIELSPVNVAMSERLIRGDSPMFANVEVAS